jgi:hypothetical protein
LTVAVAWHRVPDGYHGYQCHVENAAKQCYSVSRAAGFEFAYTVSESMQLSAPAGLNADAAMVRPALVR